MAAEGFSLWEEIEKLTGKLTVKNLSHDDYLDREIYHVSKFWRNIRFSPCNIVNGNIIHKAFKDLCRLLSLSTEPSYKTLNLACLLSTQLRSPEKPQSLLVDQDQLRSVFKMINPCSVEDISITAEDEKNFAQPRADIIDFLSSVDRMSYEEAMIFGPAFACVIVTLNKWGSRSAASKIFFLKKNFEKFYPRTKLTVRLPAKEVLIRMFDTIKVTNYEDDLRNTLFLGSMYAYHKQNLTAGIKEMLDELVLKSFRYKSMQLVTLIDEVTKTYGCSIDDYRQYLSGRIVELSWDAYDTCMAEYGAQRKQVEGSPNDSFWMYAREFNHRVFQELAYKNNTFLCNFSADLLDLRLDFHKVLPWPVLGPRYQNLTKYKRSKLSLPYLKQDHKRALDVYNVLCP